MTKTILAFDFGTTSIGVAVGQTVTSQASALPALKAIEGSPNWDAVEKLIKEWQPDLFVIGLPFNMDGSEQEMTQKARRFGNRLNGRFGIEIAYQDERLSSVEAKARLFDKKGFKGLNKQKIDSVSAVIILEGWFEDN
ncbi:Holliday junction resolvase RuvX [Thorsellia anophelis]|uniref:Putative pre-16S rRNA nuclease n=1 Tax=Thorsellia anophelis DSM 18579 TaxID=1123402 RepID=A0A1I0E1Z4_9GAMM|nr:Holliday junction resolvase RuvX [Thorsellia anophelis]SET38918.1 putative holliday junction resolvase [Thorsellia anophelis DSM 18579]